MTLLEFGKMDQKLFKRHSLGTYHSVDYALTIDFPFFGYFDFRQNFTAWLGTSMIFKQIDPIERPKTIL